jgi:Zn-dependent oligopeptidase
MNGDLPDYASVTREDLAKACQAAVEECDARIAALVAVPAGQRTFANTVLAVEEARAAVAEAEMAWGVLADGSPDDGLREAARTWGERLDQRKAGIDFDEAVYVTETRMAKTPEAVAAFLDDLRERARVKAAADLVELANANESARVVTAASAAAAQPQAKRPQGRRSRAKPFQRPG